MKCKLMVAVLPVQCILCNALDWMIFCFYILVGMDMREADNTFFKEHQSNHSSKTQINKQK
eukprot:m.205758 g.205758  ORF g.205758 m.205758 type:complete len:61 (-) comp15789_c0_seq2:5149-5331(-)